MKRLFGTDGIRGVANEHPVTARMANSLGRAVVKALGVKMGARVLIGRDTRESGGMVGRQFVRYSGTENKIRVLVEHRDAVTVDHWIAKFRDTITEEIG